MPDYRPAADRIAQANGIPRSLFRAMINQESGWNPNARSPAGARGLGQLMPDTAAHLGVNPDKPLQNLEGAARYLSKAKQSFGSWPLALAAYNAGFGAVAQHKGIPPYPETQNYVKNIMAHASLSAGGTPTRVSSLAGNFAAPHAPGALGPSLAQRRLEFGLTPDPALKSILGRSVGGDVASLLGQDLRIPQLPHEVSTPTSPFHDMAAPTPMKGWQRFVGEAPTADRAGVPTSAAVKAFVGTIGRAAGRRLMIGTGSNHSRMTVDGNVSDHWSGHAADIPASGKTLRQLGYLALIQAGMSPMQAAQARRTGGLFNVGPYQIIFATSQGGNHFNHLHVGIR